jgi:hypothetical protein
MKKTFFGTIAALAVLLVIGAGSAMALDPIPQESGFSGFIRPGVGYLRFKSNLVASFLGYDLSEKSIGSVNDKPDAESNGLFLIPFSIEYTFASTRTQLFLGTDLTDLVRFDMSQQFGVKQGIGSLGILQGGVLFSGIPAKVWEDPYVENRDRDDTDRDSMGARLVWDRILGSQLQVQYTYRNIDIDDEKSGQFLIGQGRLTSAQAKLLERDGDRHVADISYRFNFDKQHILAPAFIYGYNDLDGDAMKNDSYDLQLTYAYFGNPFAFTGNVSIGQAEYDDDNPIYNKDQEDDRYGIQGTLYYKNPWDWGLFGSKPMNFYIGAAYVKVDSNIDFYDQEAIMTTAGVFFKW